MSPATVVPRFGEKEAYMGFMNEFLEHNWGAMATFLQSVANPEGSGHMATYDGYVDLALELATLHLLLCDIFSSLDQATQQELEPLPTILTAIRDGTPVPVSVRLSSIAEQSPSESSKPGFVPPRALSKLSPLVKSQSLTSVRRTRARDDAAEPEPSPSPSRERRHVSGVKFKPGKRSEVKFKPGERSKVKFKPSELTGVKFKPSEWSGVKFKPSEQSEVKFKPGDLSEVKFKPSELSEV
ncbi:hypothetical protein AV530_002788 [Patagioenas fasciata monilis]|uniref:Uncharacterized protein n=1 Tax=Patagioenas fasciata monilis TaxID=372326 RepID=A0A1V4K4V1_PATFA|nr:hypothetical protein AV530_002788 [Patagioenas fasciata monilis]